MAVFLCDRGSRIIFLSDPGLAKIILLADFKPHAACYAWIEAEITKETAPKSGEKKSRIVLFERPR